MAITITSAEKALKSFYLDAISEQLNTNVNPFLAAIEKTSSHVNGKGVVLPVSYGINGGFGAGTEEGDLPECASNRYEQFVAPLKNLYGVIQISDKAVRASENNAGAMVNLLNAEMESLIKASKFNFGRMLFGDGSGKLCMITRAQNGVLFVDNAYNLVEGMVVDIISYSGTIIKAGLRISTVNVRDGAVLFNYNDFNTSELTEGAYITVQNSKNNEITGLGALFDQEVMSLYGVNKMNNIWLSPYTKESVGEISELIIQTALDDIEQKSGSTPDIILCSMGVRRALQKLFSTNRRVIDTVELAGGYKAMSYNGIPIVADRFCPIGTMYMLNTKDFCLHQLCDWQWLSGEDGRILQQVPGKPIYTATLVKYAELVCSHPGAQGMLSGITEA